MTTPTLSIVVPVYNEESGLETLFARLYPALDALGESYEIVFINDGSRDRSAAILRQQFEARPDVTRVILFAANAGQHMAIMAGFEHCRGEIVVTLDADLQNPPEEIGKLVAKMRDGHDYVGSIRANRQDNLFRTWASWKVVKAMLRIPGLDLFTTMNAVNERLLGHPKLVQLFNRYATYNGSNPYKTPGLLTIIPHFEHHIGAYYPQGGMYAIAQSLYHLALRKGARFHFEAPVTAIRVENGKAVGLEVKGAYQPFDRIVSNMDVFFTYRRLLPDQPQPERILRQEKSTSALIFYWGIKRSFPELNMHNIFFSDNYREEFDLLNKGQVSDDPTIYVNLTSKHSPEDAPPGAENWFVLVNVPYHSGQDWDQIIARTRANALQKLSRILNTDVEALIECEDRLDPRTIESRTSSHLGALYGTSSHNRMAAFLRHPNFSSRIKNLYFCGGSVHPGGGIPLCLLSAKLVNERIEE